VAAKMLKLGAMIRQDGLVEAFLEMMSAERGAGANTLCAYARDLKDFADFAKGGIAKAGREEIRAYLVHLSKKDLAPSSQARRLSALRQFFGFLYAEGARKDDPTEAIAAPKSSRPLPKLLSPSDLNAMIKAASSEDGAPARRLSCIVEMLYGAGLRVSELVGLPLQAVKTRDNVILVRGKGGKERLVPLNQAARAAIDAYLDVRAEFLPKGHRRAHAERYLFCSRAAEGYLTRQRLFQLLKDLALKAGLDRAKVSPHVLRHAFATHLVEGGADLRSVQTLLGHADIATTEIYTHVAKDHLKKVIQAHPLAKSRKT
jgi:integrase/recombinase XerD